MSPAGTLKNLGLAGVLAIAIIGCGQGQKGAEGALKGEGIAGAALTEEQKKARVDELRASLGAPAAQGAENPFAGPIDAVGLEPFWSLTLLEEFATFQRPGLEEISSFAGQRELFVNGAMVTSGPLSIALKPTPCTLSEGAETLPFSATVMFEGDAYEGCARPSSGDGGGIVGGWAMALPEFLPAIDTCLAKAQAKPARVSIAYLRQGMDETEAAGTPAVRIIEADGGRFECIINPAKPGGVELQPLSDRDTLTGEREPMFTRAPNAAPTGGCWKSEEARSGGGVVGWLSREAC
jgi:uncharacterized membrane protein